MKYKLPEGFKLSIENEKFQIYDSQRKIWGSSYSLKEIFRKIEIYLDALSLIKTKRLPNDYEIIVTNFERVFYLIKSNGYVVMASNSIEHLFEEALKFSSEKEATKTTELDLQIAGLNNGEEIEI